MDNKSACLISCSDHYEHRLNIAAQHLMSCGYKVTYITSDFNHVTKRPYRCKVPDCVQLHTRPYYKNLSLDRILSHRQFAVEVFRYLETLTDEPSLLVILLPPNYLAKYASDYKKRHPNVRLIFDIFDLWPETFPSLCAKSVLAPVFRIWAWLRDHNLDAADYVVTECELFRQRLGLQGGSSRTVYLAADRPQCGILPAALNDDAWQLCYLGSINNIVDIPKIKALLSQLATHRGVTLHIIGSGERQQELIDSAGEAGAEVIYHGAVYDDLKKQEIMRHCHFGLNILKDSVCIGLTMKSVDYFRNGLPIINNVSGDTGKLVASRDCGILLSDIDLLQDGIDINRCMQMRENTCSVFEEYFERSVIIRQYGDVIDQIV